MSDKVPSYEDLVSENKELKYKLFWKNHNAEKFGQAMLRANMDNEALKCACPLCIRIGHWNGEYPADHPIKECRFRPWLFSRMEECGITTVVPDTNGPTLVKTTKHLSNEQGYVFKMNYHVVIPESHYAQMTWGKLIWESELGSEELEKLLRLFSMLKRGV